MNYQFEHRAVVRWSDLDLAGVLNNAVYLTLCEEARQAYFEQLGLLQGAEFPFLLGEARVRFLAPARNPGELRIRARTTRLGRKSFDMEYEILDGDVPLATAGATLIWVGADLSSCVIPEAARSTLATFEGIPAQPV